jgi:excinuclease UvrABC nuclease subunit
LKIKETKIIYDDADKILIKLRNEAHRFANVYRQKQMSKEWK